MWLNMSSKAAHVRWNHTSKAKKPVTVSGHLV